MDNTIEELTIFRVGMAEFLTREAAEEFIATRGVAEELAKDLYAENILSRTDAEFAAEYLAEHYTIVRKGSDG